MSPLTQVTQVTQVPQESSGGIGAIFCVPSAPCVPVRVKYHGDCRGKQSAWLSASHIMRAYP